MKFLALFVVFIGVAVFVRPLFDHEAQGWSSWVHFWVVHFVGGIFIAFFGGILFYK